jgi:hypothetical protein
MRRFERFPPEPSANPWQISEGMTVLTAEIARPTEQNADSNLLNLLIVDDERPVRESCKEVANALGFHTSNRRLSGALLSDSG